MENIRTKIAVLLVLSNIGCVRYAYSQEINQTVTLNEVEIKAARVIRKDNGVVVFPTSEQKKSSNSGFSILQKLYLPNIRIDDISSTVTAIDNRGNVQLRIDGIIAGKPDMLALNPESIVKVEFIDAPGVRYGNDVAYLINIITKRPDSGYSFGTDLKQTITAKNGSYSVFGKWNAGKSEFSLNYGFGYKDFDGNRMEETADYSLSDGSVYSICRNDVSSLSKYLNHNIKLIYNLADSANYVFQASLSGDFNDTPDNFNRKSIKDGTDEYIATDMTDSKSSSPVLDLYFSKNLPDNQSLAVNAVGTYINTSSHESYNEGTEYAYGVSGNTYSVLGEGVYENKLSPFTLSAGVNFKYKYTDNEYSGDVTSVNRMRNGRLYLFSDIRGSIDRFSYTAGVGVSYTGYRQGDNDYKYWAFCPKIFFGYRLNDNIQLSYNFSIKDRFSRIAMISDVMIRNNSMEWTKGSPGLKPSNDIENTLKLAYNRPRIQSFVQGYYKACIHPNMALYERTDDNKFVYTQTNQKNISVIQASAYLNYWIIPQKLSLAAYGGLFRCFNFGDNYTHCYTSYFITGSIDAYLGDFTISAYADNGWRFLEGETKGYSGAFANIKASYKYKNWQFALSCQQPFVSKYKMSESELLNENIHKITTLYSRDYCNLVSLNISFRFNKGRKYNSISKNINLKDTDTGIIK